MCRVVQILDMYGNNDTIVNKIDKIHRPDSVVCRV